MKSVFDPYIINLWQKSFRHARQCDLFNSGYISTNNPEDRLELGSKALLWTSGAAQTDLLWRELLIAARPAAGGKRLNAKQTGHGKMGVGHLKKVLLFLPLPHPSLSPKGPKLTDEWLLQDLVEQSPWTQPNMDGML